MDQLRLLALDEEDLAIVSAHCQDAVTLAGDLLFRPNEKRFVMTLNRFVWEKASTSRRWFGARREFERRRSVLHFDRVLSARRLNLSQTEPDTVLSLLALRWTAGTLPSGSIELVFAGGPAIRLDVECIEAQLADQGAAWGTQARPDHDRV